MFVVAGHALFNLLQIEKEIKVSKSGSLYKSNELCEYQKSVSNRGIVGAEIVLSNYGYSVRYNSGLQNWGLLASSRHKQVNGTFQDAVRWAREWTSRDPAKRYVTA